MILRWLSCVVTLTIALIMHAGETDELMRRAGLVNLADACPEAVVELMYARNDNFTGVLLYNTLSGAWLRPEAAEALQKAVKELDMLRPGYKLLIKDASRPMSVQRKMYNTVRGTSKARYVGNPANGGGLHNYGMAVDITILDEDGKELPMGTPVDHLGREANIDNEDYLVRSGVITKDERNNRVLLRRVMQAGGWKPLKSEWWHFNLCTRAYARKNLPLLNF